MNVLLIGAGGREHALAWALLKSPQLDSLYCAPGNGGTAGMGENVENHALDTADHDAVIGFCRTHAIDFVVVGPEAPLVAGLVDDLDAAGIRAFGPGRAAARLEGSKGFTKDLCAANAIPTAAYARFDGAAGALAYVAEHSLPLVVKADGLAAGKGVTIARTRAEAVGAVERCFFGDFGAAGAEVVVEEFLTGEEASFFALVDGENVLALASAQDHKRAFDGDEGPNTGGMGAYSPAPVMTEALCERVLAEIIRPTVAAMAKAGTPYRGVLFAGLMITDEGPKLIEYNVRFGDPECQVLMLRLASDLLPALLATTDGGLDDIDLDWSDEAALTVVMAAKGYPGGYEKGSTISGLEAAGRLPGVRIFHAGTMRDGDLIRASGGRVLNVAARARTVREARERAYEAIALINWPDGFWRRDIAWRAIEREVEGK